MMHDICRNNQRHQARLRRQAEKLSGPAGAWAVSASVHQEEMRCISAVVGTLLKYTGFRTRARQNCFDYRLERNHVYLPDLPVEFDGYTILHLSDLHADGRADDGEGLVRIVKTASSDLCVMTGDFLSAENTCDYETCLAALRLIIRSVSARDGIFGVLGNHDLVEMVPAMERMGVHVLLNDAACLQRGAAEIVLAGVDDPHYYKCHDLQKALSAATPDQVVILLSHSPEIASEASGCGVDLYLCGHTHGGQICLPGGTPVFVNVSCNRRYVSGNWKCGDMQGYTSRGAGYSFMPARIFCPPEITLHTLHAGSLPGEFCGPVEDNSGRWFDFAGHAVYA